MVLQQGKILVSRNLNQQLKPTVTIPETNIVPQDGWLEDYFPIGEAYFQGRTVSFRDGKDSG